MDQGDNPKLHVASGGIEVAERAVTSLDLDALGWVQVTTLLLLGKLFGFHTQCSPCRVGTMTEGSHHPRVVGEQPDEHARVCCCETAVPGPRLVVWTLVLHMVSDPRNGVSGLENKAVHGTVPPVTPAICSVQKLVTCRGLSVRSVGLSDRKLDTSDEVPPESVAQTPLDAVAGRGFPTGRGAARGWERGCPLPRPGWVQDTQNRSDPDNCPLFPCCCPLLGDQEQVPGAVTITLSRGQ